MVSNHFHSRIMVVNTLFCRVPGSARILKNKNRTHTETKTRPSKSEQPAVNHFPCVCVCACVYDVYVATWHTFVETDHPNHHPQPKMITDE